MASKYKELEEQLFEVGKKLLDPPSSLDKLLSLLDQVENFISKVEQSPTDTMQLALAPSLRALIVDKLFRLMRRMMALLSFTVDSNDGRTADEKNVGAASENAAEAASDGKVEPANDDTLNVGVTNRVSQSGEDEKLVYSASLKNTEDADHTDQEKHIDSTMNAEPQNLDVETAEETDDSMEYTAKKKGREVTMAKRRVEPVESSQIGEKSEKLMDDKSDVDNISSLPCQDQPEEAASEDKEVEADPSMPKALEIDSGNFVSPTVIENLRDGILYWKFQQLSEASSDAALENAKAATDPDAARHKHSGKTGSVMISNNDKTTVTKNLSKKRRGTASKLGEKQLKQLSKKATTGSTNVCLSSLRKSDDKKCHGRGKAVLQTDAVKKSSKVDGKEKISYIKSDVKPIGDDHVEKETPEAVARRNHIPVAFKEYGEEVVGRKVKVWWPNDQQFYEGKIDSFDNRKKRHRVVYDDGDVEVLHLKWQKFEFIGSNMESEEEEPADGSSADEEANMPLRKKVKTISDQSKRQSKMEASRKLSGTSSIKAKSASAGQKSKDSIGTDGKSVDVGTRGKFREQKRSDISKSASKTNGDDVAFILANLRRVVPVLPKPQSPRQ